MRRNYLKEMLRIERMFQISLSSSNLKFEFKMFHVFLFCTSPIGRKLDRYVLKNEYNKNVLQIRILLSSKLFFKNFVSKPNNSK